MGFGSGFGRVEPAAFKPRGVNSRITRLDWQNGTVTLGYTPYTSNPGYSYDFIGLGGDVFFSLHTHHSEEDFAAGLLTWSVPTVPWQDGDLLMLRIRETGNDANTPPMQGPRPTATPVATPTPTATPVPTPAPTATPVATATPQPTATPTASVGDGFTANFQGVPDSHGGESFSIELYFNQSVSLNRNTLRRLIGIEGGSLRRVSQSETANGRVWDIEILPGSGAVTVSIPEQTDCSIPFSLCHNGRPLSAGATTGDIPR